MFDVLVSDKYFYGSDGVQDMLPQNMLPWHIEYFKLKELEKCHVQKGLSDIPLKQVIKPSYEVPFLYLVKGASLSQKTKGH